MSCETNASSYNEDSYGPPLYALQSPFRSFHAVTGAIEVRRLIETQKATPGEDANKVDRAALPPFLLRLMKYVGWRSLPNPSIEIQDPRQAGRDVFPRPQCRPDGLLQVLSLFISTYVSNVTPTLIFPTTLEDLSLQIVDI